MLDAPQDDRDYYEDRCRPGDDAWPRSLTPHEKFALYCKMFNQLWSARRQLPKDELERLERREWEEKLEIRRRLVDAFAKLDAWRAHRNL